MNYDQIKAGLANARSFLDAGNVAEADRLIRSMVGQGMTKADLDAGLTDAHLDALRKHARKVGGK